MSAGPSSSAPEPFAIHALVLESGGMIGISRLPGRTGDLAGDVAIIRTWPADVVVSMTGEDEMARRGADELPEALAGVGIAWRHFPVRDFGAPEEADRRWPPLGAELAAMLKAGKRVLVHCMGGCGRSGMVAMRLLVETGMEPAVALERLRAVRPCAVETDSQGRWAGGGAAR